MYKQLNPCHSALVLESWHEHNKRKQQECDMCFCLRELHCVESTLHEFFIYAKTLPIPRLQLPGAVMNISRDCFLGFFFPFRIFILLLCIALLHQRSNKRLQGQRSVCALHDKTIKLIVLQTVDKPFPLDNLSFHHYRRSEGFDKEKNWRQLPPLIFIFFSVIRTQHSSHPQAPLFALMKGTSQWGKWWWWNRLAILQSRQKRQKGLESDAESKRAMAVPLLRQIELLGYGFGF